MRHYLGDVLLEFDKNGGCCNVFKKGEKVRHYDNVMLTDIQGIQDWAATLSAPTASCAHQSEQVPLTSMPAGMPQPFLAMTLNMSLKQSTTSRSSFLRL